MTGFVFPNGLTRKQAGRIIDIADALQDGGIEVEAFIDANLYTLNESSCEVCGQMLEAGWCYRCKPVWDEFAPAADSKDRSQ